MSGRAAFNLALLAILGMYLAACWFVHPIADDFVFARDARAGLWTAWLSEYAGFSGRYASNALVLSGPAAWGAAGYRAAAALMLIGVPAAAYAFVRAWFTDTLSRSEALACALVFSALYVSQMPSTGEGIYWYTAAATHHAPLVLVLVHLALVLRSLRGGRGGRIYLFAAFVLLVAVAGFNEVMTLLLLGFYAAWTVWSAGSGYLRGRAERPRPLALRCCLPWLLSAPSWERHLRLPRYCWAARFYSLGLARW